MFAEVIPALRLPKRLDTFTYTVPAELEKQLRVGTVVEVLFRARRTPAVVIALSPRTSVPAARLKPIIQLLYPVPLCTPRQLALAQNTADYYVVSLGLVIKSMLPDIPKRPAKSKVSAVNWQTYSALTAARPRLGSTNFWQYPDRQTTYNFLAALTAKSAGQILILVPEIKDIERAGAWLSPAVRGQTTICHSGFNKQQSFSVWQSVQSGQSRVIIGTRQSVWLPFKKLSLIMVLDEIDDSFKQWDQNPRYDARTLAQWLATQYRAKLLFLAASPRLSTFQAISTGPMKRLGGNTITITTTFINLKDEIKRGNSSLLSEKMRQAIFTAKANQQKAVLYLNRRGIARSTLCTDCGYTFHCPHCLLPLPLHAGNILRCHHCGYSRALPQTCPNCRGVNFKLLGQGTEKLAAELRELWPGCLILRLDADASMPSAAELDNADIYLGTDFIFKLPSYDTVGLVGVLLMDNLLAVPSYQARERLWQMLARLRVIAKSSSGRQLYIQTFNPEHQLFSLFRQNKEQVLYEQELTDRREAGYPPFSHLVKLLYASVDQVSGLTEAKRLRQTLTAAAKQARLSCQISAEQLVYTSRVRGRWRYGIIMRSKTPLQSLLQAVPDDWLIDVDPITLL
ncbi:primosomal protein N' [Candidatus Falkowbacteria bacterium]|nr:primosomal protein N' [Candidatus Falkowbacteria bacterium]